VFIGPAENDQVGFLKGDFLDHIKPFPAWSETKYCCRGLDIYDCKTCKRVTKQEMLLWMLGAGTDEGDSFCSEGPLQRLNNISTRGAAGDVAFRLQRYEIIRKADGQIFWKTVGLKTVKEGTCTVLEDILFIGPSQDEQSDLIRQDFLANLRQLPKWEQTKYYCPQSSLYDCRTWNSGQEERKRGPSARRPAENHDAGKKGKKSARFKLKKSDLWKNRAILFSRRAGSGIMYAADLVLLKISLSFAYLIRHGKEIKGRWYYKKGKRSSVHHCDD